MKPKSNLRFILPFPLAAAIASLLAATSANAANFYWDTNGNLTTASAATGTWGTDNFWSTDSTGATATAAQTIDNTSDLFFSSDNDSTGGTVTVNGTQSAHSITFEEGAITLSGGTLNLGSATAGSGLSFANVSGYNMNTPIILNSAATNITLKVTGNQGVTYGATGTITGSSSGLQTITIGGPGSAGGGSTFNGIISDGGGGNSVALTVDAASTTTLAAANTYTGATNIIRGTLSIGNASTFSNTSAINLTSNARLDVNAANSTLAKLATAGGGSGVVAGSFLRYSQAQTAAGAGNGPGTIFGTVELNLTNVNPNYTLDFGSGGALTNVLAGAVTYTSALTLSGTASIDSSQANATHIATYSTGGITASNAGAKTLNLTGSNTGANTISGAIGNGSGTIGVNKGGGGTWVLSGTNTYTGNTRVDGGTLQFTNQVSLYNNGAAATWTKDNIIVGNGATLAFNVGGAGQFTKANINTLLALSDSASNGFTSGSNVGLDTTGGTLLFDSVIANTNSGANVLGLTKLGTGTLTLDQNNTYTGNTVISGGILQLGAGSTTGKLSTSSTILNNGTLTINRSDAVAQGTDFSGAPIVGTGAFINAGGGTTTLNAANTFSGSTTVSGGVLALTHALALQNSALNTTGAGFVTLSSATPTFGGLSNSGTTRNLATVISSGYSSVTNLTLNTAVAGPFTYGGIIGEGASGMTLTKTGTGTQILSGVNSYTGATTINGGTLNLGGGTSTGSLASTVLNLNGGTLSYTRTGSQTQSFTTTNVNSGASGATTVAGNFLKLGDIVRNVGGTLNVGNVGAITTTDTNVLSILGGWATYNNENWAVANGDASAITALGTYTGGNATASTYTNANIDVATATVGGTINANSLRFSGASVKTLTLFAGDNIIQSGGILVRSDVGNNLSTITGGNLLGSASGELIVHQHNTSNSLTIASVIKDNVGSTALTKSGGGALTLSGLNTYSGGLIINAGIVKTAAVSSVSSGGTGTGAITVQGAGTLELNSGVGTLNRALTLNGGKLYFNGSGNDLTVAGTIALGANSTIDASNTNSGFAAISSNISGAGGFTKTGLGGLRLNGTNTYTGPTVISAGGVTVKSSLYGNDTTKWTPANITVANISTLALNVGGAGEFTIAQAATLFSQLSSNVNNNGLQAGSFIGVDTRNAPNGIYTYSGNITDSTGAGGGSVGFKHTGTANHILELTGTNTYTGLSIVDNDAFLKVSSINSVFTNAALGTVHSASSSLGAPTTVANGTIHLGTAGSTAQSAIGNTFRAGGLIYTGTGETTDRIISMNDGGGGVTSTLDQSGTGHLKFISSFTAIDTRGTKTLLLRGSTTGTGEIAGLIPNATSGGGTAVTKSGTGTWILSGANLYAGTTTINGGTLLIKGANNLPSTVAIATSGNFSLADGTARATNGVATGTGLTLATGSTMAFDWNGGSLDSFTTGGTATSTGSVGIIINNTSPSGSGGTLITAAAGSTLNTANYFLANNTNFTAALSKTATTVSIGAQTAATALTNAYWKRNQVTGALDTMAYSLGTLSNWASDATGTAAGGVVPGGTTVNMIFGTTGSAPGSPTLGADMNLGSITFNDTAAVTLAGSNAITLNSTSATAASTTAALAAVTAGSAISVTSFANATNTISAKLVLGANQTWNIASAKTLNVSGVVSGTHSITKADAGTLTLSGANIYTGATIVTAGTLKAGVTSVSGFSGAFGNNSAISLADTSGVVMDITGFNTQIGSLTGGGATGGNVTLGAATLTVGGDNTSPAAYAGIISGTNGVLSKIGAGTQILSGANSYTGATNVNAGKLLINGSTSTSSAVTVASGATLGGSGTVGGAVTIQAGGTFSPGNSIDSIATGNLALLASATFAQEIDKSAGAGVSGDLTATTGTLSIASGATLTLAELGASGTWNAGDKITLIGYSTGTWDGGLFTYLGGTLNDDDNFTFSGTDWTFNYNDTTFGDNYQADMSGFTGSAKYVTITAAIPEPRAALLGGLGLLMLLRRRRA